MSLEYESWAQLIGHMSIPCSNESVDHPLASNGLAFGQLCALEDPDDVGAFAWWFLRFLDPEGMGLDLGEISDSSSELHGEIESMWMLGNPSLSLPV